MKKKEEKVFKKIDGVLNNDEEYQQLIEKAKRDIESYKERYDNLLEKNDLKNILFEIYKKI